MKKNTTVFENRVVLVVGTGPQKKRFIFQRLKKLGLQVILLNKEKNWAEPYISDLIQVDTGNHTASLEAIERYLKQHPSVKIEAAVCFWEYEVLLTSKIVQKYKLIGIPFSIAEQVRNKYLFREFCREDGLPAPAHRMLKTADDVRQVSKYLHFPLVIKPIFGAGSDFVIKIDSQADLEDIYEYVKQNLPQHPDYTGVSDFSLMAEEYIDGDEVDIDFILQNGKVKFVSVCDNYKTREPFFCRNNNGVSFKFAGKRTT